MAWADNVQSVGKWYQANIHNYNQGQYTQCSLPMCGKVRHDCSGYVSACLRHAGIIKTTQIYRSGDFLANGSASSQLARAGFVCMPYNINSVQPFDIIARNGHVEIYAGKIGSSMRSWSWGSCHDGINGHMGMPAYMSKQAYTVIWRMGGSGPGIATPWNDANTVVEQGGGMSVPWGGMNAGSGVTSQTYSSTVTPEVFTSAMNNAFTPTTNIIARSNDAGEQRTRIYSAMQPTIKVDELSIPMNEGSIGNTADTEQA